MLTTPVPDKALAPGTIVPRLVIADPGLTGLTGHHLGYSQSLTEAARARDVPSLLLASHDFQNAADLGHLRAQPWFRARYRSSGAGGLVRRALYSGASRFPSYIGSQLGGLLRGARRILQDSSVGRQQNNFGPELVAALRQYPYPGPDIVLAHSVSAANIESLLGVDLPQSMVLLHIVLRRTVTDMDRDDGGHRPIDALLCDLAARLGPRLRLHADTPELARQFAEVTRLVVADAPLPIQMPSIRSVPIATPPSILFPGGARLEKGYAYLPEIVRAHRHRAGFVIHSSIVDASSDPIVQRAHRALLGMTGAGVTVIQHELSPDDYAKMVAGADLVLLPYDAVAYAGRSSGILGEALALGIPAVVPAGCWMADMVADGSGLAFLDPGAISATVNMALNMLPTVTTIARSQAISWRNRNSPDALLTGLLAL